MFFRTLPVAAGVEDEETIQAVEWRDERSAPEQTASKQAASDANNQPSADRGMTAAAPNTTTKEVETPEQRTDQSIGERLLDPIDDWLSTELSPEDRSSPLEPMAEDSAATTDNGQPWYVGSGLGMIVAAVAAFAFVGNGLMVHGQSESVGSALIAAGALSPVVGSVAAGRATKRPARDRALAGAVAAGAFVAIGVFFGLAAPAGETYLLIGVAAMIGAAAGLSGGTLTDW